MSMPCSVVLARYLAGVSADSTQRPRVRGVNRVEMGLLAATRGGSSGLNLGLP
jgi:hypothetical protein